MPSQTASPPCTTSQRQRFWPPHGHTNVHLFHLFRSWKFGIGSVVPVYHVIGKIGLSVGNSPCTAPARVASALLWSPLFFCSCQSRYSCAHYCTSRVPRCRLRGVRQPPSVAWPGQRRYPEPRTAGSWSLRVAKAAT